MIDQSHNIKPKVEEMIQSVVNLQEAYARALVIERAKLAEAQVAGDVVLAEDTVTRAFRTDVTPLLAQVRVEMGLAPDPMVAYRASGYYQKVCVERQRTVAGASGSLGE
jgi:L-rhamnose isomerase/sugar isomerase